MEFLESIFDLSQKDFLPIITASWIVFWLSTVLGIVICTVSAFFNRRVFEHLRQKYIRARNRGIKNQLILNWIRRASKIPLSSEKQNCARTLRGWALMRNCKLCWRTSGN